VTLATTTTGSGAPRVTIIHGFTQVGACMRPLAEEIGVPCRLVDAPFHGGSSDVDVDLAGAGAELAAACGGGVLVGYSMGARIALHAILAEPDCASAVVLVSGTAGIADDAARSTRRAADAALAARILELGTGPFIEEWLAQPMFAGLPRSDADRALRATNRPESLARSVLRLGQGVQEPLWDRLGRIARPVTVIAGSDDPRYAEEAVRIAAAVQRGSSTVIAGAGHAVHVQEPAAVASAVRAAIAAQ
jgi:2-succinyl-6-hydroxy-2,4-cyclohexadiene-1-carboxylate synthase